MGSFPAIFCGVVCGIAAATPLLVELRRPEPDLGRGFGSVIAAFAIIQLAMFVVHKLWPALLAPFGVPATLAFLVGVVVGVLRHRD